MENKDRNKETLFFEQHTIDFKKSKGQEWRALQQKLERKTRPNRSLVQFTMGAVATVLLALTLFIQFYSKDIVTQRGEHLLCLLPDGSKVQLNADTKLTYYPLRWYIVRNVKLQGEAFFEVEKGSRFTVKSKLGNTQVLGTSFNVYAREDAYKVACVTGKVRVKTQGNTVNILPNETVEWDAEVKTLVKTKNEQEHLLAWKNERLLFQGKPLREVFDALELQYDVYIAYYPNGEKCSYSGNISLEKSIEENLTIVCKPFQKKWEKSTNEEEKSLYLIN